MKQIAQKGHGSDPAVYDVPVPNLGSREVLVQTAQSILSAGTERTKVELASSGVIAKARRRPDLVRQVADKVGRDGLGEALRAVRLRLDGLSPLGYSAAGTVVAVGEDVRRLRVGERVACGGAESGHAEFIAVPEHLCATVPDAVGDGAAAFTTIGSIAMHAFRQSEARLGERVAVIGLGLVGQLVARIAKAAGCEVMAIDLDESLLDVALRAGAADRALLRSAITIDDQGRADVVLVSAAAVNNDPVSLAIDLARHRGCVVIVGDVPIEVDRRRFYEKELELRISRSYGPGRHDREYEERGLDYPVEYVRWTEQRNMAAFLRLLESQRVTVDDLITQTYPIDNATEAYAALLEPTTRTLAIAITYPRSGGPAQPRETRARSRFARQTDFKASAGGVPGSRPPRVAFIGAGSFAQRHLIPYARAAGLELDLVATLSGLTARSVADRFGFRRGAATVNEILADEELDAVFIATRHVEHASLVLGALQAGKHVFVEKPLCLRTDELDAIEEQIARKLNRVLMVGFNRRYAPMIQALDSFLARESGPTNVFVRINAGTLPGDHWINDPLEGGGRLVGEGCHFVDLIGQIVGARPVSVTASSGLFEEGPIVAVQNFVISLTYDDGSLGTIAYGARGSERLGKELVEAHRGCRSARIDDFTRATLLQGRSRPRRLTARARDKGHRAELKAFVAAITGRGEVPDPASYILATRATLAAMRALRSGSCERVAAV